MFLRTISTGSKGNSYALFHNQEILLLDLGVKVKDIKKSIDFRISDVVGCLVTHKHLWLDHSLSVTDFKNMGIQVYEGYKDYGTKKMGSFKIKAFPLPHDDVENCGYYIKVGNQKILYMTDFEYCKYIFAKQCVDHILIECNYQQELISEDLPQYYHKIKGHASLKTCKDFIEINKTDNLKNVLLLHMGGNTCNPMECVEEIQNVVGENVYVNYARKGLEISLTRE